MDTLYALQRVAFWAVLVFLEALGLGVMWEFIFSSRASEKHTNFVSLLWIRLLWGFSSKGQRKMYIVSRAKRIFACFKLEVALLILVSCLKGQGFEIQSSSLIWLVFIQQSLVLKIYYFSVPVQLFSQYLFWILDWNWRFWEHTNSFKLKWFVSSAKAFLCWIFLRNFVALDLLWNLNAWLVNFEWQKSTCVFSDAIQQQKSPWLDQILMDQTTFCYTSSTYYLSSWITNHYKLR